MEAAGEYRGGASTAALVICIIIAVVGVGLAFYFYNQSDAQKTTIEDQKGQIQDLDGQLKSLQTERGEWVAASGFDTVAAMETAVKAVPDAIPATAGRALEILSDQARQTVQLAQEIQTKYQTASQELENLRAQLQQTQETKDAEIGQLDQEKAALEADLKKQIVERDDLVAQLRDQKRAAEDEAQEAKDQLEEATIAFKSRELADKALMVQMQEKIQTIEGKVASPDGRIVAFDNDTGFGAINLGEIDHVQRGMIFLVYNQGRGGEVLPKGRVQVRRVEEKSSIVGIIESVENRPVTKNDYVMTALLGEKKPVFVIAGWFPPALDYTPRELTFLVERWGGKTAEAVSLDTDYLVVGKIRAEGEDASPEAKKRAEQGLEAYNLARELGVNVMDVEDFIKLVQR